MKRLLSNLVLGSAVCASTLMAAKVPSSVSLKISGSLHGAILYALQQNVKRPKGPGAYVGLGGNLTALFDGRKGDIGFGAVAAIDIDRLKTDTKRVAEAYVFLNGPAGSVFLGGLEGPATTLMHDATDALAGSKGSLGWAGRTVDAPIGVNIYSGLRMPPSNKIAFTSASMSGLTVGISYSPDTSEVGRPVRPIAKDSFERKGVTQQEVVELAANFTKSIEGKTFGLYLAGVVGSTVPKQKGFTAQNLPSYAPVAAIQVGALFSMGLLRVAGGYFNWGKSSVRKGTPYTAPRGFNLGAGVTLGKFVVSAGYFYTTRKVEGGEATNNYIALGADYLVAPGCTVYAEVDFVNSKSTEKHVSKKAMRSDDLDSIWDTSGLTSENGGAAQSNAQIFVLGMKIQC